MSRLIDHVRYVGGVVGTSRGGSSTAVGPKLQDMIVAEVNHAVRRVWGAWPWTKFGVRDYLGRTFDDYSTGTVTVTQGLATITGSGTSWTKAYEHGIVQVAPTGNVDIRLRVRSVDSATQLTLMGPWGAATEAGLTYTLFQDTYPLAHDASSIVDRSLNLHDLAEPLSRIDRRDLDLLHGSTTAWATGEPQRYIDDEVVDYPLWNAGTVTTVAGSTALVGSSSDWNNTLLQVNNAGDVLVNMPIMVYTTTGISAINQIASVTDGTNLVLKQPFRGPSEAGVTYDILPAGSPLVQLWPPADSATSLSYRYRLRHIDLVNNNDVCLIPSQWDGVVDHLAASRALLQMKGGPEVQAQAQAQFLMFKEEFLDMVSWDHPQKKHPSRMMDQGLVWEFLGGVGDTPTFAGPSYWRAT